MNRYHPQAHRPPPWWVGLLGLIACAVIVAVAIWFGLATLMSLRDYIPSLP